MKRYALTVITLALTAFSSPHNDAAIESACLSQIRSCFTFSDDERDLCFQRTSRAPECKDDSHGQLAAKRAAFSSIAPEGADDAIPSPDANLIDHECVENFDNFWLSTIVHGSSSEDTLANLQDILASCTKSSSFEMMRP
jgi:hypothetical protein